MAAGISGCNWNMGTEVVHHCYNIGAISGSVYLGSIIGEAINSGFNNCWWTTSNPGNGRSGSYDTEISSKVTEETLKGYVNNLGSDYFTEDDIGINEGFPILKWEKENAQR